MTKRNPYLQHTYESFDQPVPPKRPPQEPGFAEKILGSDMLERVRSPLFATVALLLTGAAFAGIIIASYPDNDVPDSNIPVITADATPLRDAPSDPGGMTVAHEDSTIYNSIRSSQLQETPPIENLLAEEKPVEAPADNSLAALGVPGAPEETTASAVEPAAGDLQPAPPAEVAETAAVSEAVSSDESAKTAETSASAHGIPMKSDAASAAASEKPAIPPAASTPETLAYVRSVLENKDAPKDMASAPVPDSSPDSSASSSSAVSPSEAEPLPTIEPASGAAAVAGSAIKPGSTYIQLASIGSESAAPKEWAKLQKAHSSLAGLEYRVQRADLGAKGVFYRIQAGPMSKDSAKGVCASIKASKPGGCIIVQ
jgi:hypothetical protein